MDDTSSLVWRVLEQSTDEMIRNHNLATIKPHIEVLFSRRRGKHLLRPYVGRLLATLAQQDWKSSCNLKLLASIEALNLSTYHANFAFDNKAGVSDSGDRNGQFVAAMLLRELAQSLISDAFSCDTQAQCAAISLCSQVNQCVYVGQHLDMHVLTHDAVGQFDLPAFEEKYYARCILMCGATFRLTMLPLLLSSLEDDVKQCCHSLLNHLGAGIQAINDLADFDVLSKRTYADSFSDLLNQRLTLPAYLLHASGASLEMLRDKVKTQRSNPSLLLQSAQEIKSMISVHDILNFVLRRCWQPIRLHLRFLHRRLRQQREALMMFDFIPHLLFESRLVKSFQSLSTP